jgi:hypothetical protein
VKRALAADKPFTIETRLDASEYARMPSKP